MSVTLRTANGSETKGVTTEASNQPKETSPYGKATKQQEVPKEPVALAVGETPNITA